MLFKACLCVGVRVFDMLLHVLRRVSFIFVNLVNPIFSAVISSGGIAQRVSSPEVGELGKQGAMPRHASLLTFRRWCIRFEGSFFPAHIRHP